MAVLRCLLMGAFCLAAATFCSAQERGPAKLHIDTDVRLLSPLGGKSVDSSYTGTFRLASPIGSGWSVDLDTHLRSQTFSNLPSTGDFMIQQASVQREWKAQRLQLGVVRLPFGIYDYRETYASGLIDYPITRVDNGLDSVDWGVPGGKWSGGSPALQIEAAAFSGSATGVWGNHNEVGGGSLRVQTYTHGLILGASHWQGTLALPSGSGYGGRVVNHRTAVGLNGLDVRFTRPHLIVRGEFLFGVLGGDTMDGWYLDVYYHLPKFQRFTIVARGESLHPSTGSPYGRQFTLGVRYTATADWILAVNWRRNNFDRAYSETWTPYSGKNGALFLQIYHKARF